MDREKVDSWCEKGILALALVILVFSPVALGGNGPWEFLVIQGLTVATMFLWVLRLWIGKRSQILWPPICWAVAAFMGYAIARYYQADLEYVARKEMIRVLVYGFLFLVVLNNLHRQESMQLLTLTVIFVGMAISLYAGYQFLAKTQRVWFLDNSTYAGRGSGTFIYPNHLAGYLEMLMPIALCYVLMGRLSHVMKIFLGYAAVVMLVGIGVTVSRGGWLVTGLELVILCVLLVVQRDYRLKGLVLLGVLLVAGIAVVPRVQAMQARMHQMIKTGKADDLRLSVWQPAIEIWEDNFWWGAGPAHFDYRFPKYRPTEVQLRPVRVHNDYLNTLADWGLVGALLVASAFVIFFWGVLKVWRTVRGGRDDFARKKSTKYAFLLGASVGLLGILMHSLLDFQMHIAANAILMVTLLALVTSQWRFATERFWFRPGVTWKLISTVILFAGMGYFAWAGNRTAREFVWLHRASVIGRPPKTFTFACIAALEQANKIEPNNFDTTYDLGECYRLKYFDTDDDKFAPKAKEWYERGMKLNPYDGYNWLDYGMCADRINLGVHGKYEDSSPYYRKANELDPNGYFTTMNTGWHYVQVGDPAAARTWFERSRRLEWSVSDNNVAYNYLPIVERELKEGAEAENRPDLGQK